MRGKSSKVPAKKPRRSAVGSIAAPNTAAAGRNLTRLRSLRQHPARRVDSNQPAPSTSSSGATLSPLARIDLDVEIDSQAITVTERREYLALGVEVHDEVPVQFYRSLPANQQPASLMIQGQEVGWVLLDSLDADATRRDLVTQTTWPGPLREYGTSMMVSDPVTVTGSPTGERVVIELVLEGEAAQWDTLDAVVIPMEWHPSDIGTVHIAVRAESEEPLRTLYAPYHGLNVTRESPNRLVATFDNYGAASSNELALMWSTGTEPYRLDLLPFRYNDAEGGFFMALLSAETVADDAISVPRDLVFVLDTSGSMDGAKIRQAKESLSAVLGQLREQDTFSIVGFDTDIETFSDASVPASRANITDGQSFVSAFRADGGTNIMGALDRAFDTLPINTGHARYIVMLTDGMPTEGEQNANLIVERVITRNEVGARIFSFGVGHDVNTVLLDRLADETGGQVMYIRPGENVAASVEAFFERIVAPVLADPELDFSAYAASQLYPEILPDLFSGQTVQLLGRYDTGGTHDVALRGTRDGQGQQTLYSVTMPEADLRNGFVPRIWAARHIGAVLHEVKLGDDDPALLDEALLYANRYGIVNEFTYWTVDAEGNMRMDFGGVSDAVQGEVAVETSAALDEEEATGSIEDYVTGSVRYHSDRAMPSVDGWHTDTSVDEDSEWFDFHFASDKFFDLLDEESAFGLGGYLSQSTDLRFDYLGRPIRITAIDFLPEGHEAPSEAETFPAPVVVPDSPQARAEMAETTELADYTGPGSVAPFFSDEEALADPAPAGCCAVGPRQGTNPLPLLLLGALVLGARRRTK